MGVLNRTSLWLATWIAIRWHFSPASRKVCIDYLCQTYRPNGQFSVGLSSNGRIMVKPTDCSLSKSNTSSLLENQTSIFREGHLIVKIHKKKNDLFAHVRRKAYLCSWTITSWEMPLKDTSLWMHSWSPRRAKCGKSQDTHAKRAWEGNSPRHIEGVYSTLCLRHTEILQPSVSKSRI